ncbi:MAG: sterol desaturase/sphingolipid hydroxylase (fatty acid hydroxylase superfamily) [Cellvibrionaceae bacterium]|jgi:sterol desaturase/sphingolipid hydroxylase (fatty acid hydroxylase superfamily)
MFEFNDQAIRVSIFLSVFILFAVLETVFPKKHRTQPRLGRWLSNIGIIIIDSIVIRLIRQVAAVSAALIAAQNGWGLLNWFTLPLWLELFAAIVLLDLAIYIQHIASHKIPLLWRMHRVHHADRDIDVTTGARFHPLEIMLSMFYKGLVIFIVGPSILAVFLFEVILNASSIFNHANLKLTAGLDKKLRLLIVTPDMHRVHHSIDSQETNSNFGFFLSIWDKLFKTYKEQPRAGHLKMIVGIKEYQDKHPSNILWCLKLPFIK